MPHFIPVNEELRRILEEDFSRTPFRTPQEFVEFYNSGLASSTSDVVKTYIKKLQETYKDIEFRSNKIIFLDSAEIYLSEFMTKIEPYELAVKVRREVLDAINRGELSEDDFISIGSAESGYLVKIMNIHEDPTIVRVGIERLVSKPTAVEQIYQKFSSVHQTFEDNYIFRARDFALLDVSFIENINNSIPS